MNIMCLLNSYDNIMVDGFSESAAFSLGLGIMYMFSILSLLGIAQRVLFALAAYYDAKSKCNKDAVMWGLLIGFLGLIPGIIYLCIRNSAKNIVICPNCGLNHLAYDTICPRCGAPNKYMNPLSSQHSHRAKVLLTIAIVIIGVAFFTAIIGSFVLGANIINFIGHYIYY